VSLNADHDSGIAAVPDEGDGRRRGKNEACKLACREEAEPSIDLASRGYAYRQATAFLCAGYYHPSSWEVCSRKFICAVFYEPFMVSARPPIRALEKRGRTVGLAWLG
jgi:hypothetical protein